MARDPARSLAALYAGEAALPAPRMRLGDPRLAFLTTLTLAPLYALVDLAQRLIPGPDTAFSQFYTLPVAVHALAFLGIYALVWLAWFAVLAGIRAARRERHPLLLVSQVSAIQPVLRTYFLLVFAIFGLLLLTRHLSLGLGIQAGLLLFTFLYAGQADRLPRAKRAPRARPEPSPEALTEPRAAPPAEPPAAPGSAPDAALQPDEIAHRDAAGADGPGVDASALLPLPDDGA